MQEALGLYACISKGDVITINHLKESYEIEVVDCKPEKAIGLIETDVKLEFVEPKDFQRIKEEEKKKQEAKAAVVEKEKTGSKLNPSIKEEIKKPANLTKENKTDKNTSFDPRKNRIEFEVDSNIKIKFDYRRPNKIQKI